MITHHRHGAIAYRSRQWRQRLPPARDRVETIAADDPVFFAVGPMRATGDDDVVVDRAHGAAGAGQRHLAANFPM